MSTENKEKLVLEPEFARNLLDHCGEYEGYEEIERKISGTDLPNVEYEVVIQRLSDKKFFAGRYLYGQYEDPWKDEDEAEFTQVFPVEKTVIVYE